MLKKMRERMEQRLNYGEKQLEKKREAVLERNAVV